MCLKKTDSTMTNSWHGFRIGMTARNVGIHFRTSWAFAPGTHDLRFQMAFLRDLSF